MTSVVTTMIDSSAAGLTRIAVEHVPRDGGERRLVDGDAGLVGHLDAHESSSLRSSAAFAALLSTGELARSLGSVSLGSTRSSRMRRVSGGGRGCGPAAGPCAARR